MIGICPNCQQRYSYPHYDTDYIHDCHGNTTVSEEDVLVVGDYEDEITGSIVQVAKLSVANQGLENKAQGTDASITDGLRTHDLTKRGKIRSLYRQRKHFEYINLKKGEY